MNLCRRVGELRHFILRPVLLDEPGENLGELLSLPCERRPGHCRSTDRSRGKPPVPPGTFHMEATGARRASHQIHRAEQAEGGTGELPLHDGTVEQELLRDLARLRPEWPEACKFAE